MILEQLKLNRRIEGIYGRTGTPASQPNSEVADAPASIWCARARHVLCVRANYRGPAPLPRVCGGGVCARAARRCTSRGPAVIGAAGMLMHRTWPARVACVWRAHMCGSHGLACSLGERVGCRCVWRVARPCLVRTHEPTGTGGAAVNGARGMRGGAGGGRRRHNHHNDDHHRAHAGRHTQLAVRRLRRAARHDHRHFRWHWHGRCQCYCCVG